MEELENIFPFFEKELIQEIFRKGIYKNFKKGEVILSQDKYIRSIPLILNGHIKISRRDNNGNEIVLYYIKGGETCANTIQCCETHKKSNIIATAEDEVSLILVPIELLEQWTRTFFSWKDFLLINYKEKFNSIIQTIDKVAFNNLRHRLEVYLKEKYKVNKNKELSITHQQVAYELNSSREVISRYLKEMEAAGEVVLKRKKIILNVN